jgi:hypothetical protein
MTFSSFSGPVLVASSRGQKTGILLLSFLSSNLMVVNVAILRFVNF